MINPYVPYLGRLADIQPLGTGIKLFKVQLEDQTVVREFTYRPGQFAFVSAFGVGEAPFGITSVSGIDDTVDFAINKVGT
ncbi:MAG: hydrogenase, partial [Phycisphaerae bacterium]